MKKKIIVTIDRDLEEIIPTFLENRQKDLQAIETALNTKTLTQIETIAHKLAGNAGSYGLDALGEIGIKMELACQSNDVSLVENLYNEYKDYIESLQVEFK